MKEVDREYFDVFLDKLQRQFLCCHPVREINWQNFPKDTTWEQQQRLVESTYMHPLNQESPVKIAYQLNFLKRLLKELESQGEEVHDLAYEKFCEVQQRVAKDATAKYAYKHYILAKTGRTKRSHLTLREWKSFVAEGTTGLCSWQASIALADYLLHHTELVRGKRVLELGSGTGLAGFVVAGYCEALHTTLTDGSAECIQLMRENIRRNFPDAHEEPEAHFQLSESETNGSLTVQQLLWNELDENSAILHESRPDLLLAADVVYDDAIFEDLIHAISTIFKAQNNQVEMLLVATVRNKQTLHTFLTLLKENNFEVVERDVVAPDQSYLYWDRSTPVKILSIVKTS